MEGIISTIVDLLGNIPVIGDIVKTIMGLLGMGGDDASDDQANA